MLCIACKTEGPAGRYCSHCGALRDPADCAHCGTALDAGSRFCHNCGMPVASAPAVPVAPPVTAPQGASQAAVPRPANRVPWIIGGVAAAALLVVVAAQRVSNGTPPPAPATVDPAAPLRAPDISQMTPRERAARLFDRVMRLDEEGKSDSVRLFAAMAIPTFQSLQPLDAHVRYDLGRVALAAGELQLAQAQADSILQSRPQHLLGLLLAALTAERRGDTSAAQRFRARFRSAEAAERAANLEEYRLHEADLRSALAPASR
jgi:hypothetical protein